MAAPSLTCLGVGGIFAVAISGCGSGSGSGTTPPPQTTQSPVPTTTTPDSGCTAAQSQCSSCLNGVCQACVSSAYHVQNNTCVASCTASPQTGKLPAPANPYDHNGAEWPMRCISDKTSAHFFGIGDWGGDRAGGHVWDNPGRAASRGGKVPGPDDWGQKYVARQMNALADEVHPDYVLGVGDNFYPGGVESTCGNIEANIPQFDTNFNQIYTNLKDKPWYSVLGNHDYGGISFTSGWDSQIQRTWNVDNWIMPSQVYHTLVQYKDFSVRYFFLDSNHIDASSPPGDTHHNICQRGGCWDMPDINHCADVFARKWEAGVKMVEDVMANNTARGDWNIVVSHFPETGNEQRLRDAGVDLVFSGHYHHQRWNDGNLCKVDTLISGGGGGVTADDKPMTDGNDDSYGFIDFEINRTHLAINFMTWGGCQACDGNDPFQAQIRRKQIVKQPRQQGGCSGASVQSVSV